MKKLTYVSDKERVKIYFFFNVIACYQVRRWFGWRTKLRRSYPSGAVNPTEAIIKAYNTQSTSETRIVNVPTISGIPVPVNKFV